MRSIKRICHRTDINGQSIVEHKFQKKNSNMKTDICQNCNAKTMHHLIMVDHHQPHQFRCLRRAIDFRCNQSKWYTYCFKYCIFSVTNDECLPETRCNSPILTNFHVTWLKVWIVRSKIYYVTSFNCIPS